MPFAMSSLPKALASSADSKVVQQMKRLALSLLEEGFDLAILESGE